jgi:hypothetical protein
VLEGKYFNPESDKLRESLRQLQQVQ